MASAARGEQTYLLISSCSCCWLFTAFFCFSYPLTHSLLLVCRRAYGFAKPDSFRVTADDVMGYSGVKTRYVHPHPQVSLPSPLTFFFHTLLVHYTVCYSNSCWYVSGLGGTDFHFVFFFFFAAMTRMVRNRAFVSVTHTVYLSFTISAIAFLCTLSIFSFYASIIFSFIPFSCLHCVHAALSDLKEIEQQIVRYCTLFVTRAEQAEALPGSVDRVGVLLDAFESEVLFYEAKRKVHQRLRSEYQVVFVRLW